MVKLQCRRPRLHLCIGKIPWRREWKPTSVFLLGEFHGQRSLVGYSQWGHKESDMTEQLSLHFNSGSWKLVAVTYLAKCLVIKLNFKMLLDNR